MSDTHRIRFGDFELDFRGEELLENGRPVKLARQPFKVLRTLALRAGEVVGHDELRAAVWNDDTHVNFEGSLHSCVKQIRSALGDDASAPRFVETVPRRGYRFLHATTTPATRGKRSAAVAIAAVAVIAAAFLATRRSHDAAPPPPLIADGAPRSMPADPAAYDAYLKGRYHLNSLNNLNGETGSLDAAERYLREAVARDDAFPDAHVGLATVHLLKRRYDEAEVEAKRALTLTASAEAHFALALARWYGEWDWTGAGESFRRALVVDPDYAKAHHWYAYYLTGLGRYADAIEEIERALELDPLSPQIQSDVGWFYYFAGRFEASLDACERTLELEPGFDLAEACIYESRLALGIGAGEPPETSDPYGRAVSLVREDRRLEALDALAEAIEKKSAWVPMLAVDPRFEPLRRQDASRYARLLDAAGFR